MKKIISAILLLVVAGVAINCSKDDAAAVPQAVSQKSEIRNYLKNFYSTDKIKEGRSIAVKSERSPSADSKNIVIDNYRLTEVFVGNDTIARGYVVTDRDTDDFHFFIDVDRVNFKLTDVKIDNGDTKVFDDINLLDKWLTTNKFDIYQIAADYNTDTQVILDKRPFWGWSGWHPMNGDCSGGHMTMINVHYSFWHADGYQYNVVSCN